MLYSFCLPGIKENDPHECYRIGYLEGNGKMEESRGKQQLLYYSKDVFGMFMM